MLRQRLCRIESIAVKTLSRPKNIVFAGMSERLCSTEAQYCETDLAIPSKHSRSLGRPPQMGP